MNLWKLELVRLFRTRRWIAIVGVYTFFGFLGPLTARYMEQILENFGGGIQIVVPEPVAADGITSYVANAAQIGLLVSLGVAAAALAFDAKPQMGIFLRTRVKSVSEIIVPRFVVMAAAVAGSFVIGSLAALYESVVLLGSLSISGWAIGTVLGCIYLVFAVAVVAAVASKTNSVLMTMTISVAVMLALPIMSVAPGVAEWLPSHLVGAVDGLVRDGSVADYLPAIATTVAMTAAALWLSVRWAGQREL